MTDIRSTFQQLPGINAKREVELWATGLRDWRDLRMSAPEQFELYEAKPNSMGEEIQRSEEALSTQDLEFFAKRRPRRELHRIACSFPEKCIFLDIETTGLSVHYDTVTLLGWSVAGSLGGAEAVTPWFDYKDGSVDALKQFIRYNHADVEGMKSIFEESLLRPYFQGNSDLSCSIRELFPRTTVNFITSKTVPSVDDAVHIMPYVRAVGPRVVLKELEDDEPRLGNTPIVGLDLTDSEKRGSGWAIVRGALVDSEILFTDDECLEKTLQANPKLVSIGSPLSLPRGRLSEFDDDPGRVAYGVVREAERQLRRRGISSFPALLPRMQKLTARGIKLATSLRRLGIPVVESYPGAAQDILGIPRKQNGLSYLSRGLTRFGFIGLDHRDDITHDELDAVTSALVGQFLLSGRWEGVGCDDEDYMIVPTITLNAAAAEVETVVGISGSLAAGKTTAARVLQKTGFRYFRFSELLAEELKRRHHQITRGSLQALGSETRKSRFGQRQLQLAIASQARGATKIVVDGLRHPEDHAFLFEQWGFKSTHIHIQAPKVLRVRRLEKRNRDGDSDLMRIERHEIESGSSVLDGLANKTICNDRSEAEFELRIRNYVESIHAN